MFLSRDDYFSTVHGSTLWKHHMDDVDEFGKCTPVMLAIMTGAKQLACLFPDIEMGDAWRYSFGTLNEFVEIDHCTVDELTEDIICELVTEAALG